MRLVDVDLEAARAAYEAKDEAAFAAAIAPLGVELDIATLHRAMSIHPNRVAVTLEALYRAVVDDAGVGTARMEQIRDRCVAMAVRLDDRVVFGVRWWSHENKYGWPELRRWYKDTARNREHMVAWASTRKPPPHTVTVKLRARPAAATDGDGAPLLAAVLAAPADDAARLVYADWLLEQGDPRGELIQLECALAGRPDDEALGKRVEEVRVRCAAAFDKLVDDAPYSTRRGFIDDVTLTVAAFGKRGAALLAAQPVDRLGIAIASQPQFVKLAGLAIPKRLAVTLVGNEKSTTTLYVGLKSVAPIFADRARVGFKRVTAAPKQWAALLRSPACAAIRELAFDRCALTSDIVPVLADCDLDALQIEGRYFDTPIYERELAALRRLGARVRRLSGLGWIDKKRFQAQFEALLADSAFVELGYDGTSYAPVIVKLLAASKRSRSLRRLAI
ncbi:MAG TPA: TIGR02996 domain-containing protein, partial [Kofleriaceae bacterium]